VDRKALQLDDYLAGAAEITTGVAHYLSRTVLPAIDKGEYRIGVSCVTSDRFTARVVRLPEGSFEIRAYEGLAKTLGAALAGLEGGALETLEDLSEQIFADPSHATVIAGSILSTALIFVFLHEYGHIAAGHFGLKRSTTEGPGALGFEFDECEDRFSLEGAPSADLSFRQLLELEADLVAFNLVLDLSYPMFVANNDAAALIQGHEFDDWRDSLYSPVVNVAFYASSLAIALIAAHQGRADIGNDYPLPITRMMNLAMLLLKRAIDVPWDSNGVEHRLHVDAAALAQISSSFTPTLLNSIELAQSCCIGIGCDLKDALRLHADDESVMDAIAGDFIGLIKRDGRTLQTREARQGAGDKWTGAYWDPSN
jgi:hypothetical protein